MADPVYEHRGAYDNSRLHEALIFRIEDRRVAVFKSHHPDRIGVAVEGLCWTITPQQLIQALKTTIPQEQA